jgi:FkbM family methyltransferase
MSLTDVLLKTYSLTRKTGLLDLPPMKALFVASYDLYKRYYEDPFYSLTLRHPEFFRGGEILDIGANIGYTAQVFARAIDAGRTVYAFEPEQENCNQFQKRMRRAKLDTRVELVPAVVGAERGEAKLWFNAHHHADHRVATESFQGEGSERELTAVPMWSVDTFVEQRLKGAPVAFIKIDVQGFELPVLQGMKATIENNPGVVIALEYSPAQFEELGFEAQDVLAAIDQFGLEIFHLEIRKPLRKLSIEKLNALSAERGYIDLLLKR